jgi:hypothetical protein
VHPRRAFPRFAALLAAAFAVTLATSSASAQSVSFVAILAGVNELPSNASPATGVARAVLNTTTRELSINGEFSGLLSNAVTVLIHQAPPGVNGPVQFRLGHTGTMSGSITGPLNPGPMVLTEAQQAQLLEGNWYVNVHTVGFPGGEIRGQLFAVVPEPATLLLVSSGLLALGAVMRRRESRG